MKFIPMKYLNLLERLRLKWMLYQLKLGVTKKQSLKYERQMDELLKKSIRRKMNEQK